MSTFLYLLPQKQRHLLILNNSYIAVIFLLIDLSFHFSAMIFSWQRKIATTSSRFVELVTRPLFSVLLSEIFIYQQNTVFLSRHHLYLLQVLRAYSRIDLVMLTFIVLFIYLFYFSATS